MNNIDAWALMGKRVLVREVLVLKKEYRPNSRNSRRFFVPEKMYLIPAWVIGFTTVYEGLIQYLGDEEGCSFKQTKAINVMIVRFSPRRKQFFVPMDKWELIEKEA